MIPAMLLPLLIPIADSGGNVATPPPGPLIHVVFSLPVCRSVTISLPVCRTITFSLGVSV